MCEANQATGQFVIYLTTARSLSTVAKEIGPDFELVADNQFDWIAAAVELGIDVVDANPPVRPPADDGRPGASKNDKRAAPELRAARPRAGSRRSRRGRVTNPSG
jgi:hypothetical protein